MESEGKALDDRQLDQVENEACPLVSPLVWRVPGLLSLATFPAAVSLAAPFFSLAGGLLALLSVLLAPPRRRGLGLLGLVASVASFTILRVH